ncbi:MAG: prepilin-type N-terminal cleavage/methylation domain-containing protein [Clostridia bacterium]|nr:prepilin-type N-terminal cleavage/methylation domain-containing protein [Clostridia bacterium]
MSRQVKTIKSRLSSKRGMTLVEVLVALSILMLIIFTFTPLFASYIGNIRRSGEETRKTYKKASLMERLLANSGKNDGSYESIVNNVPLTLTVSGKSVSFGTATGNVGELNGKYITTDADNEGSTQDYVTFLTGDKSLKMVCFPTSLSDDFLEKTITVVPIGFNFKLTDSGKIDTTKFVIRHTNSSGEEVDVASNYYVIDENPFITGGTSIDDPEATICVKIKFYGANETICFQNSPLHIYYTGNKDGTKSVTVEITAPKIIMVGEKAHDGSNDGKGSYYYYATSGVEPETGKMDIIAKQMGTGSDGYGTGSEASSIRLVSAMNDVEWVEKGKGDDGEGGVNEYGYYIMGGDAGQVRRFWRQGTSQRPGNYYWDGDNLGQYDRYYYITSSNRADSSSYENINQTKTTQAQFKSIFRSGQGSYDYNGVSGANVLSDSEITTLYEYKMITSNYYTANVTKDDTYITSIGRILSLKNGSNEYRYAGNGTDLYDQPKGLFTSFVGFRQTANGFLRTSMAPNNQYSKIDADGYIEATNYEYQTSRGAEINDKSLITITSVGAIQINKTNNSEHSYYNSTQSSVLNRDQLYPEQSYTLYCGYIPAVVDTWGWKTKNIGSLLYNNYSMWFHTSTLGIATDGEYWYPVGKFGDTHTSSATSSEDYALSSTVFGNNPTWSALLNYGTNPSLYPFGNTQTTITTTNATPTGKYIGKHQFQIVFEYKKMLGGSATTTETPTTKNTVYESERQKFCTGTGTSPLEIKQFIVDGTNTNINDRTLANGTQYTVNLPGGGTCVVKLDIESAWTGKTWRLIFPEEIRETEYKEETTTTTGYIRYYGPTSDGSGFSTQPSDVTNATLTKRSFIGTALPQEGNDYYMSAGHEVDITIGYLSQPYAIGVQNPATPQVSGLSGLDSNAASERYFKKYDDVIAGGQFNHSFFSGGLRDNVTMLDVKSYHDDITGNNLSLAVGYSLSYMANDNAYLTRLGHVMNNGMVYIRATGNGVASDDEGLMESGKGWSLKQETNVFHQFYGIDQYNSSANLIAAKGWNTQYHRNYFNITSDSNKAPQNNYSPNFLSDYKADGSRKNKFYGNNKVGTNCHPLADTQVNTVNWGMTWDTKTQAMWGTENGTLLSWAYDYEKVSQGDYEDSKITGVRKEFESFLWADRYGSVVGTDNVINTVTGAGYGHYDFSTQAVNSTTFTTNKFISVLASVNNVLYADDYWVAVGDQSGRDPKDYCGNASCYSAAGAGSFINVKFDNGGLITWKAIKVSDDWINFISVEYCEGIWYAMGYFDTNHNGEQDTGEDCVMYYALDPSKASANTTTGSDGLYSGEYDGGWRRASTRNSASSTDYTTSDTKALRVISGTITAFELQGINSMASQG